MEKLKNWSKTHGGGVVLFVITVTALAAVIGLTWMLEEHGDEWSWTIFLFWISLAYLIASFRFYDFVKADQVAARTIFGAPLDSLRPGMPFAPPGIVMVHKFSALVQQLELPGEPENIYRGEMKGENVPPGSVPPIRIPFRTSVTKEEAGKAFRDDFEVWELDEEGNRVGDLPLEVFDPNVPEDGLSNRRVTAEAVIIVRYRIHDAVAFIQTIGDIAEANRQIEDVAVTLVNRYFTRMSAAQALNNIRWMNMILFNAVQRRMQGDPGRSEAWGVDLETANIKLIGFNHELNDSIAQAAQASFLKQEKITAAEGTRQELALEGEGRGEGERRELLRRGEGFAQMAKKAGLSPTIVIASETARAITSNPGQKTILVGAQSGIKELMGVATAIGTSVKETTEPESSEDPDVR